MRRIPTRVAGVALAISICLVSSGCGSGTSPSRTNSHRATSTSQVVAVGGPTTISGEAPSAVVQGNPAKLAEYEAGKRDVAQSGCLACHKIGENGNAGPGQDLTEVGDRLPPQAIARTLENPTAPMPSFAHLPHAKFRAIVAFLAQLK